MSANPTNLELILDIYAGVKDGRFDLSHDPKDKWHIAIVQLWKNSYERVIATPSIFVLWGAPARTLSQVRRVDNPASVPGPVDGGKENTACLKGAHSLALCISARRRRKAEYQL